MGRASNTKSWVSNSFKNTVVAEYIEAPFTSIQNRAKVLDESNALKALMPVERIMFNSISGLDKEFGPNGEKVYEIANGDSRVRFYGNWKNASAANGTSIFPYGTKGESKIEISFYGTGLNILTMLNGTQYDIRATIDNGSESGNIITTTGSSVLNGRNYNHNIVINVVSGLSLGWHTVVLRYAETSAWNDYYGIEILNEQSQLNILKGKAFNGADKFENLEDYLGDFKEGVSSNGGRKVWYLNETGINYAVTNVGTARYLTNVDHSNEETVRRINWREFGANRSDDFSTLSTSVRNAAFTLDDGTTTLTGEDAYSNTYPGYGEGLSCTSNGDFRTLVFVGTGLSLEMSVDATLREFEVFIDDISIGVTHLDLDCRKVFDICSDLPYGSHVVKLVSVTAGLAAPLIHDFIIYQPKRPEFDGIELFDTNILADFIINSNPSVWRVSQGTVFKSAVREITYVGSGWSTGLVYPEHTLGGYQLATSVAGDYLELNFYGTGFEIDGQTYSSYTADSPITIDGVSLTSVNFPSAIQTAYGMKIDLNNGTFSCRDTELTNGGCTLTGLPLGYHKLRITVSSNNLLVHTFRIITPMHINDASFKVGSLSGLDKRQFTPQVENKVEVPESWQSAKAYVVFDQITNKIVSSKNVSQALEISTGHSRIFFEKPFKDGYVPVSNALEWTPTNAYVCQIRNYGHPSYVDVKLHSTDSAVTEKMVSLVVFGELADE